jgi:hypothetical protein
MASPSLALPGVLFVGEDERARLVAHLGPAAGWMIPKGVLGWSHEVSVVARDALSEQVRRDAKIVMPDEQIPPAKMPLTHQAALKSPLVSVSGKLTQKLVDAGIRVHTVGADRVTSSFYYIAEGGGEDTIRVEGDLVAAVGAMLGDRADNAAIERVLDGLVDRLLRSLSKDRVAELSLELAAALPRAAADGTGTQDIDLESFEKELSELMGSSDKYTPFLREIATKIEGTNERRVDIPLYGDARKVSQGPFELLVGEKKVGLVTHERWLATGPLAEPSVAATPAPAPASQKAEPAPAPPQPKPESRPEPKPATPRPAPTAAAAPPANMKPLAAPLNPPRPASNPPGKEAAPAPQPAPAPAKVEAAPATVEVAAAATPAQQSGATERPAASSEPVVPKEEPVKAAPAPTPSPSPAKPVAAKVVEKAKPVEDRAMAKASDEDDSRLADTQKVKRKEKGIPWLWILVAIAAAFAAYRLFTRH